MVRWSNNHYRIESKIENGKIIITVITDKKELSLYIKYQIKLIEKLLQNSISH